MEKKDMKFCEESNKEIDDILVKISSRNPEKDGNGIIFEHPKKPKKTKKVYQKHKIQPFDEIGISDYFKLSLENLNDILTVINNSIKNCE